MPFLPPSFYPILDASFLPDFERASYLARVVEELKEAGVTLLQYRNKQGSREDILTDAEVMRKAASHTLKLIMNDHPDLAVEADFDGVHVGQGDMSPADARRIVGEDRIVGVSTHNRAQLEIADTMPVDYVAFGPVFATSSKLHPDPVVGLDGLREARALTRKPLVAIGGITLANVTDVLATGADSAAVISALFGPGKDLAKTAREFLAVPGNRV